MAYNTLLSNIWENCLLLGFLSFMMDGIIGALKLYSKYTINLLEAGLPTELKKPLLMPENVTDLKKNTTPPITRID